MTGPRKSTHLAKWPVWGFAFSLMAMLPQHADAAIIDHHTAAPNGQGAQISGLLLTSCPRRCSCEKSTAMLEGGSEKQLSLSAYCYGGNLDDEDFLTLLQSIPSSANAIEIVAPVDRPNRLQWSDNLNRFAQLKHLKLINCGIPALSETIRLPALRQLILRGNRVEQLQMRSFLGLPMLETLDLSHNRIDTLPTGAFLYLKKLKRLSLSHNRLSTLAAGLLNGPQALEELELDGNMLMAGAKQLNALFSDTPHLRRLEINECQLNDTMVAELHLTKVPELRRLGIGGNNLTRVPSSTIRALAKLTTIDLSHNVIRRLEPCAFCGCNVSRVLLANNDLGLDTEGEYGEAGPPLHPEAFTATRLVELDLSFNSLSRFKSFMLHEAKATLEVLHLSGNSIPVLGDQLIAGLPTITHLHMASNGIRELPLAVGRVYRRLEFLNLSSNALTHLPLNAPSLFPRLSALDISHNQLASIPPLVFSSWISRLMEFRPNNNPWDCACGMQPLQHYLLQRLNQRHSHEIEHTRCATPEALRGQPLHLVQAINECAIFLGEGFGLVQASQLLIVLAGLLLAAFLVCAMVIFFLYCSRERKEETLYAKNGAHVLTNGDLKVDEGRTFIRTSAHSLSPGSLSLANGTRTMVNGAVGNGIFTTEREGLLKMIDSEALNGQLGFGGSAHSPIGFNRTLDRAHLPPPQPSPLLTF